MGDTNRIVAIRSSAAATGQRATRERIKQLILDQELRPGDPIPTEPQLMEELGLSRNSVREALKALQAVGIIEIRHGFGSYVGTVALDALTEGLVFRGRLSLRSDHRDLWELVEVRQALELGLLPQVIATAGDDDLAAVGVCVETMKAATSSAEEREVADRMFHARLYAPLGNRLIGELLEAFWDVYHDLLAGTDRQHVDHDVIAAEHQAIYDAVRARDVGAAVEATRRAFDMMRMRMTAIS